MLRKRKDIIRNRFGYTQTSGSQTSSYLPLQYNNCYEAFWLHVLSFYRSKTFLTRPKKQKQLFTIAFHLLNFGFIDGLLKLFKPVQ